MSQLIKVAVVGVGHLGKWHAEKYAAAADCELVAVVDTNSDNAAQVAQKLGVDAHADYRDVIPLVDAISLVVPTSQHYKIAREFLEAGIHCLIEKPVAETVDEAQALIDIARDRGLTLQVGHIERFSRAFREIQPVIRRPRFIEVHRLGPYTGRATDASVVLDLMIHDLDIVSMLADADVERVEAVGIPVLSLTDDIANARLRFAGGCVANLTASRVSAASRSAALLTLKNGSPSVAAKSA